MIWVTFARATFSYSLVGLGGVQVVVDLVLEATTEPVDEPVARDVTSGRHLCAHRALARQKRVRYVHGHE